MRLNKFFFSLSATILSSALLSCLGALTCSAQSLDYSVNWLGNTYGGAPYKTVGGWTDYKHVQLNVEDMIVSSDGTVYTDSDWDEGGNEAGIYKGGDLIGHCRDATHGWGRGGGKAVAIDSDYVYLSIYQNGDDGADLKTNKNGLRDYPDRGTEWLCIRRFHRDGKSAPFSNGYGIWCDMMIADQQSRGTGNYVDKGINGLAVHNGRLYVSDSLNGKISAFDTSLMSGTPTTSWTVANPGKIVFDDAGDLWMLDSSATPQLVSFTTEGNQRSETISFPSSMTPSAIAWDGVARRLLVADQGRDQNIKFYNPMHLVGDPTVPTSTFGVKGGVHAGDDGLIRPLHFIDPAGIGVDGDGNIYVASSDPIGGCSVMNLESYHRSGLPNWPSSLSCLEFVNGVDVDPAADNNAYSSANHYTFIYDKPAGSGWKYVGLTLDKFKYPDDPRLHCNFSGGTWARRINGNLYLFLTEQAGGILGVVRLDGTGATQTAVPYALVSTGWLAPSATGWPAGEPGSQKASEDWIWRDSSGTGRMVASDITSPTAGSTASYNAGWGRWVDQRGDIWQSGHGHIRHFKMHLDKDGRPVWDYAAGDVELLDPPVLPNGASWQHGSNRDDDDMDRVIYNSDTDTMFVSGFTTDYPDDSPRMWGLTGRVVYRYDHWSKNRVIHPGYPIILPWGTNGDGAAKSIAVAGEYLFAVEARDPETVTVYDTDTAQTVGSMAPDATVGSRSGWVDENIGLDAHVRSNGQIAVFAEEDLYEKSLVYLWAPPVK